MAKFDGSFENINGKIGNMVFYKLNGKIVGRSIGKVGKFSTKQMEVQMRTKLITPFLSPILEFIKLGFKNTPKPDHWNYYSQATFVNKPGAIKGIYPNLEIDYAKVILSMGPIPIPEKASVKFENNNLLFNWDPALDTIGAESRDQVMLLAYFPEKLKAVFLLSGARRSAASELLKLPSFREKTKIETFMAFTNEDRSSTSDSVYTGQLILEQKF